MIIWLVTWITVGLLGTTGRVEMLVDIAKHSCDFFSYLVLKESNNVTDYFMANQTKLQTSTAPSERTKTIVTSQSTSFEPTKQPPHQKPEHSTVAPGKVERMTF